MANISTILSILVVSLLVSACEKQPEKEAHLPVKGLKHVVLEDTADFNQRLFPALLSPSKVTTLSFKVPGQLLDLDLKVGQRLQKGELLAELNPTELVLALQSAEANQLQVSASLANAREDLARKEQLLKKGVVSKAVHDQTKTRMDVAKAQFDQVSKQVAIAEDNLGKTRLTAPFDGVIGKVTTHAYSTLPAGSPVVSLYKDNDFEVSFSVPYEVASKISVGEPVKITMSDLPDRSFDGQVKELGASADRVAEYPVVVSFVSQPVGLKSGMPVEIAINLPIEGSQGGLILPFSALSFDGRANVKDVGSGQVSEYDNLEVFVYDPTSQTVKRRKIEVGGIKDNALLVTGGVSAGDIVASAGVSFLRDGMKVTLQPNNR